MPAYLSARSSVRQGDTIQIKNSSQPISTLGVALEPLRNVARSDWGNADFSVDIAIRLCASIIGSFERYWFGMSMVLGPLSTISGLGMCELFVLSYSGGSTSFLFAISLPEESSKYGCMFPHWLFADLDLFDHPVTARNLPHFGWSNLKLGKERR